MSEIKWGKVDNMVYFLSYFDSTTNIYIFCHSECEKSSNKQGDLLHKRHLFNRQTNIQAYLERHKKYILFGTFP